MVACERTGVGTPPAAACISGATGGAAPLARWPSGAWVCRGAVAAVPASDTAREGAREDGAREDGAREGGGRQGGAREEEAEDTQSPASPQPDPAADAAAAARR